MYKPILSIIVLSLLFFSCKAEQDPFLINSQNIGLLTDSTKVKDLELAFPNDSIVKILKEDGFSSNKSDIEIFDKAGNHLLRLSPSILSDSTSIIGSVQILDSRYRTKKNVSTLSTFKDINDNYKISRINNLINSVVIFTDDINASFTIDKKELPAGLRLDTSLKIEKVQIPDKAKIKYFFIYWN
jgi:hypothetical protein